jgi:hypothetical protein
MAYRVHPGDPETVQTYVERLWTRNLAMRVEPRHKFQWYYRDNPLGAATAFLLESAADGQAEVVGSCGIGPRRFWIQGQPLTAGLLADFTVEKAHRTVLPGLMLQRRVAEFAREAFDLTYAYPNDAAVGIFSRIGYAHLGRSNRYVRVLRTGQFVRRVMKVGLLASPASAVADGALRIVDSLRALTGGQATLQWVSSIDERWDALFARARSRHAIIGDRSAAFLRWRFLDRPGLTGRIAALIDRAGALRAYAAVSERDPDTILLADFLADDDRSLKTLLDRLVVMLRSEGYQTILAYFLGAPSVAAALTSSGFHLRNAAKHIVLSVGASARVQPASLGNTDEWYLTEADRDN